MRRDYEIARVTRRAVQAMRMRESGRRSAGMRYKRVVREANRAVKADLIA